MTTRDESRGTTNRTNRAPAAGALGGGMAVATGWALLLWFFCSKDDPYGMGALFAVLGIGGALLGVALSLSSIRSALRGTGAKSVRRAVAFTLASVFFPLLGWTAALLFDGLDSTRGSVFMLWAIASASVGATMPVPVYLWHRHQAGAPSAGRDAPAGAGTRPAPRRWPVVIATGMPGAIVALAFGLLGDLPDEGLPPVFCGLTAAFSIPVLTALLLPPERERRRRRLVFGLSMWLLGTLLFLSALFGGWFLYELVTGLMRFRL